MNRFVSALCLWLTIAASCWSADMMMVVDTALSEVPVNKTPLVDDTDFKSIEGAVAYNASGMALRWHFVGIDGSYTVTSVTPTTAGTYDWTDQGDSGVYTIEIPASGGASINNDTEGFGWFTGVATGILPWTGPVIQFSPANLSDSLVTGTDKLQTDAREVNGVSTSSVTTVNANLGTTQPINFTGTSSSALAKTDVVDFGGAAGIFSGGRPEVNTTHLAGTAQNARDLGIELNGRGGRWWYISASGNNSNAGTRDAPRLTLASVNSAMSNNDSIFYFDGTYSMSAGLTISKKNIHIQGQSTAGVIINYTHDGSNDAAIKVTGSGANIRNLTVRTTGDGWPLQFLDVHNITLEACDLDAPLDGLAITKSSESVLRNYVIRGNKIGCDYDGAVIYNVAGLLFEGNHVTTRSTYANSATANNRGLLIFQSQGLISGNYISADVPASGSNITGGTAHELIGISADGECSLTLRDNVIVSRSTLSSYNGNVIGIRSSCSGSAPTQKCNVTLASGNLIKTSQAGSSATTVLDAMTTGTIGGIVLADSKTVDSTKISGSVYLLPDKLIDTLADTNELQGDWANGGRLDNILDARASQTTADAILDDTGTAGVAIADNSITAAKIAADAIGSSEVADGAIDAGALASDAITNAKIAADAIGASELATDAIGAAEIAADAIGASELANAAIDAATFATGAIDAAATAADFTVEVLAPIMSDANAEASGTPAANSSLATKISYVFKGWRNGTTVTSSERTLLNDNGTEDVDWELSDDGTTTTITEAAAAD